MTPPSPPPTEARPQAEPRSAYRAFRTISTRWMDNDVYGHVNNVVYYSLFDTAINRVLIERGALDIHHGGVIGLMVESNCNYFEPLAYPQHIEAGLRVAQLGRSSVRYDIGLFAEGASHCAARGSLVHVYVDRLSRRAVPLPEAFTQALQGLL